MKAEVIYQDWTLNWLVEKDEDLKVRSPSYVVREYTDKDIAIELETTVRSNRLKIWMSDSIFFLMNHLDIPPEHPERPIFEIAGHTSMTVGDYIKFEDKEIWVVASVGWKVINKQE